MANRLQKKEYGLEKEQAYLSNERTLLSYVRTALAAFLFGFALLRSSTENFDSVLAISSLIIGVVFILFGLISFIKRKKIIHNGYCDED